MEFSYFLRATQTEWDDPRNLFKNHPLGDGMPKLMGWLTVYHCYYISDEINDVITITIAD